MPAGQLCFLTGKATHAEMVRKSQPDITHIRKDAVLCPQIPYQHMQAAEQHARAEPVRLDRLARERRQAGISAVPAA